MAKKGGGQPGEGSELMLFVSIAFLLVVGWFLLHAKLAAAVLSVRLAESYVISLVFPDSLEQLRLWMHVIDRHVVTASDLFTVSQIVGRYIRWVSVPVLVWCGWRLYRSSPTERFKTTYDADSLPLAMADQYPWMKISTRIDFGRMDPDVGPWAFAKTERSFAREHGIKNERGEFDAARAEEAFARQVGTMWLGYTNLKPHAKAMFAMLAARINKDFVASDHLLRSLASSAADGKLDYTGVDELVAKYKDTKPVRRIIHQHAYESTVLMQMLDQARGGETGKDYLPPNWFLWLKGVDRKLWYALSDVGRRTFHVESAGVVAHWLAERARKKALQMPFVRTAVEGLEGELKKYTEDGDRDLDLDAPELEVRQAQTRRIPSPEEADQLRAQRAAGISVPSRIEDFPVD